jgi:anti-sigma regulatory factor (Ser/Thr protein kinase)
MPEQAQEHQQRFTASFDCLPAVLDWVDGRSRELRLPITVLLKLRLVCEELFINTVRHGHNGGSGAAVQLSLRRGPDHVELGLEDHAPAYNPFERLDLSEHEQPVMDRPVGHLGLVLVGSVAAGLRYERVGEANRLRVMLRCESD